MEKPFDSEFSQIGLQAEWGQETSKPINPFDLTASYGINFFPEFLKILLEILNPFNYNVLCFYCLKKTKTHEKLF